MQRMEHALGIVAIAWAVGCGSEGATSDASGAASSTGGQGGDGGAGGQGGGGGGCEPGSSHPCYPGPAGTENVGTCKAGTQICGVEVETCQGAITPSAEACDGLDNDCDGAIDDDFPDGGTSCDTTLPSICAAGARACKDGAIVCVPLIVPSAETCDGIDNDCNGVTDDGPAGSGLPCDTGVPGVCAAGTTSCGPDGIVCIQTKPSAQENCSTPEDEDCNGAGSCQGVDQWSLAIGGLDQQLAYALAVDSSGNALVAGYFRGTTNVGDDQLTSAGAQDIFVAKYSPIGAPLWGKRFGGAGADLALAIAVDGAGNALVTGEVQSTVDFGGGPTAGDSSNDVFVLKLDPAGNHVWSKRFPGPNTQDGLGIAADGAGNAIVTGYMYGAVDFGGGTLTGAGLGDLFLVKLGPAGNHVWSKRLGDATSQAGRSVAADAAGNLLLIGDFEGSLDFGGGALTAQNSGDVFVARLDAAGNQVWSKRFGGAPAQAGIDVAFDSAGNALIAGMFFGTIDLGGGALTAAGSNDIFFAKLDPAGGHLWSKGFGAAGNDHASAIAVDSSGAVVLTGHFMGDVDFGGGALLSTGGSIDAFALKVSPGGSHLWSKRFGDVETQTGYGVGVDAAGNVFLAGGFQGMIDFGGDPLGSTEVYDVFLAKLGP